MRSGNLFLLKKLIERKTGLDLSGYKDEFIERRVHVRMMSCGAETINQYLRILESSDDERRKLLDALSINFSDFFRDKFVWDVIAKRVLRETLEECLRKGRRLNIWSAGCAHGQEPYTIAILSWEIAKSLGSSPPVRIYATDVDEDALRRARRATYTKEELKGIPPLLLREYFDFTGTGYRVKEHVKRLVLVRKHDLIKEPPLKYVHIIFCRNVLIYFDKMSQQRVLSKFHSALLPPGYLILGTMEALSGPASELFEVVDNRARIYKKR